MNTDYILPSLLTTYKVKRLFCQVWDHRFGGCYSFPISLVTRSSSGELPYAHTNTIQRSSLSGSTVDQPKVGYSKDLILQLLYHLYRYIMYIYIYIYIYIYRFIFSCSLMARIFHKLM